MSDLIKRAADLAIRYHTGQKYGINEPYTVHLAEVGSILHEFGFGDHEELRAAAWLHDILEDTHVTASDLGLYGMPPYVIALVDAVTDRPGANRKERHLKTYPRIARIPDAVTLKLADRIANVRASARRRPDLLEMYRKEHQEFTDALSRSGDHAMWLALHREIANVHA